MKLPILYLLLIVTPLSSAHSEEVGISYLKKLMNATEERFDAREESLKTLVDLYNQFHSDMEETEGAYLSLHSGGYAAIEHGYHHPVSRHFFDHYGYNNNNLSIDYYDVPASVIMDIDAVPPIVIEGRNPPNVFEYRRQSFNEFLKLESEIVEIPNMAAYLKDFWQWKFAARKRWLEEGVSTPAFAETPDDYLITIEANGNFEFDNQAAEAEWNRFQDADEQIRIKENEAILNPILVASDPEETFSERLDLAKARQEQLRETWFEEYESRAIAYFKREEAAARAFQARYGELNDMDKYIHAREKLSYLNQLQSMTPPSSDSTIEGSGQYLPLNIGPTCGAEFQKASIIWSYSSPANLKQKLAVLNQITKILDSLIPWYKQLPNTAEKALEANTTVASSPLQWNQELRKLGTVTPENYVFKIQEITQRLHDFEWIKWPLLYKQLPHGSPGGLVDSESEATDSERIGYIGESPNQMLDYNISASSSYYGDFHVIDFWRLTFAGYHNTALNEHGRVLGVYGILSDYASTAPKDWEMLLAATATGSTTILDVAKNKKMVALTPITRFDGDLKGFQNITLSHHTTPVEGYVIDSSNNSEEQKSYNEMAYWDEIIATPRRVIANRRLVSGVGEGESQGETRGAPHRYLFSRSFKAGHQALNLLDYKEYELDEDGNPTAPIIASFKDLSNEIIPPSLHGPAPLGGPATLEDRQSILNGSGPFNFEQEVQYGAFCKPAFNQTLPAVGYMNSAPTNVYTGVFEDLGLDSKEKYKGVYFSIPSNSSSYSESPRLLFNLTSNNHLSSLEDDYYHSNLFLYATGLWDCIEITGDSEALTIEHSEFDGKIKKAIEISNGENALVSEARYSQGGLNPVSKISYKGGYIIFNWKSLYHVELEYYKDSGSNELVKTYKIYLEGADDSELYAFDNSSVNMLQSKYGSLIIEEDGKKIMRYRNCEGYAVEKVGSQDYEEDTRVEYFNSEGKIEYSRLYSYYLDLTTDRLGKGIETIEGDIYAGGANLQRTISDFYLPMGGEVYVNTNYEFRGAEITSHAPIKPIVANHQIYVEEDNQQLYTSPSGRVFSKSSLDIANSILEYPSEFLNSQEGSEFKNLSVVGQPKEIILTSPEGSNWSRNGDKIELYPNGSLKSSTSTTSGLEEKIEILTK